MPIHPFEGVWPTIHPQAFVHPDAVVIGQVEIGAESSVWPQTVIRGDVNFIRIGARVNIQDGSILHVNRARPGLPEGAPLILEDDCTVAHGVILHACHLHKGAFVAMGAIVMDLAVIGEEALVGAASLVSPGKQISPRTLWLGSPAVEKRPLREEEILANRATCASYVALGQRYKGA
ncbi:MAG: gamma carbonic anhydrase family protein [Magnetococcales bacterium]|nr:gamma carbonic anhydrase family protein [Magnetococcales bacterium]